MSSGNRNRMLLALCVSGWVLLTVWLSIQGSISASLLRPTFAMGLIAIFYAGVWLKVIRPAGSAINYGLVTILIVGCSYSLVHIYRLAMYQSPSTPWEEAIFLSATRFRTVRDIYSPANLQQPPYSISIYSPLYYATLRWVMAATGKVLSVGRYASTVGLFVTASILYRFPEKKHTQLSGLIAPLLFLSVFPTLCWSGSYFKPEFVAIPFSLAAFAAYIRFVTHGDKPWLFTAAGLTAIAILFKLTAVGAFIGISGHLLWDRRPKEAAVFVACALLPVVASYAVLTALTAGGVWLMGISANALKPSLSSVVDYLGNKYLASPLVLLAFGSCLPLLTNSRGNRSPDAAIAFYFIGAFSFFAIAVSKPGAGYSYFLEPAVGMALVIPAALQKVELARETKAYSIITLVLVLALIVNLKNVNGIVRYSQSSLDHVTVMKRLSTLPGSHTGYIMADVHYSMDILRSGRVPLVNDNMMYSALVDNGRLTTTKVMDALGAGQVPYVLLTRRISEYEGTPWWPKDVLAYVGQHYSCEEIRGADGETAAFLCAPRIDDTNNVLTSSSHRLQ